MSGAAASPSHGHIPVAGLRLLGDDRLARRAAAGDRQAFAALYQRHHQALFRYCRAILGNSEDAADALQNTMVAALRALPGEQRQIQLKPWLYRIAHNESISLLRRRPPHAGLEQAADVPAPRGQDASTRERLRELVTDLRELQDRQRAALVMRELSGLDYEEIGVALEASPTATKQLVYEARVALHEMAEGRDMSCDEVRRMLSADDGRKLRGRKIRAHMKACTGCRDFHAMMRVRRHDLAAVAPPLPAMAAAALLQVVVGGGHGGGAGGLAGLVAGVTGKAVATSAVAKGVTVVAVVATVGAGAAEVTGRLPGSPGDEPRHQAARTMDDGRGVAAGANPPGPGTSPARSRRRSHEGARQRRKARRRPGGRRGPPPRRGGTAPRRQKAARGPQNSRRDAARQVPSRRPAARARPTDRPQTVPGADRGAPSRPEATAPDREQAPLPPRRRPPTTELP